MSTILDALKKVERDREAPSGRSASLIAFITQAGAPAVPAQAGTRSGFSIRFQYLAAKISVALIPGRAFFTIGI